MDCSPPGSSVHGILQARILKWVAMPSRGSSRPRDSISSSYIAGRFFTTEPQGSPAFDLGREKETKDPQTSPPYLLEPDAMEHSGHSIALKFII